MRMRLSLSPIGTSPKSETGSREREREDNVTCTERWILYNDKRVCERERALERMYVCVYVCSLYNS